MKSFVIPLPEKSLQFKRNPKVFLFTSNYHFASSPSSYSPSVSLDRPSAKCLQTSLCFLASFLPGATLLVVAGHSSHCTLLFVFVADKKSRKLMGESSSSPPLSIHSLLDTVLQLLFSVLCYDNRHPLFSRQLQKVAGKIVIRGLRSFRGH